MRFELNADAVMSLIRMIRCDLNQYDKNDNESWIRIADCRRIFKKIKLYGKKAFFNPTEFEETMNELAEQINQIVNLSEGKCKHGNELLEDCCEECLAEQYEQPYVGDPNSELPQDQ